MSKNEKVAIKVTYMPRGEKPNSDGDMLYFVRENPQRGGPMEA